MDGFPVRLGYRVWASPSVLEGVGIAVPDRYALLMLVGHSAVVQGWPQRADYRPRLGNGRLIAAAAIMCGILISVLLANRELLLSRFYWLDQPLESRSIRERVEDMAQAWDQAGSHPPLGFRLVHNIPLLACAEPGRLGGWLGEA